MAPTQSELRQRRKTAIDNINKEILKDNDVCSKKMLLRLFSLMIKI